jgi:hypothetical protein
MTGLASDANPTGVIGRLSANTTVLGSLVRRERWLTKPPRDGGYQHESQMPLNHQFHI